MTSKTTFFISLLILISGMCLLGACGDPRVAPDDKLTLKPAPDTVPVFVLQDTSVIKVIEFPAELKAAERSELLARVQGYVKEIRVDIGDKVRRNQVLALIEAPELITKQAEYQAALQASRSRFLSSNDLYQRLNKAAQAETAGIVAPVELTRAFNNLMADSASFQAAKKLALSYEQVAGLLVVRAPFAGIITTRNVDRGALVGSNQVLVTVENNRTLRLRIAVPEQYISTRVSKDIHFKVDAFPERLFTGTLSRKSGTVDTQTRTEIWEYAVDNERNELVPGTFAYVTLSLQRAGQSFVVGSAVIATNQERKFVIRVKDGKADWVDVRQGMSTEKGIEVFGDLKNGDTLLVRATEERKPGTVAFWKL